MNDKSKWKHPTAELWQGRPLPPGAAVGGRGRDERQEHGCAGASRAGLAPLGPGVSKNGPGLGTLLRAWGKNRATEGCGLKLRLVHSLLSPPQKSIVPCCCMEGRAGKAPNRCSHCHWCYWADLGYLLASFWGWRFPLLLLQLPAALSRAAAGAS